MVTLCMFELEHPRCATLSWFIVRPDFFILWFTDIFAPYGMSGFGIKIKIKFQWYIGCQARKSLFLPILSNKLFRMTEN